MNFAKKAIGIQLAAVFVLLFAQGVAFAGEKMDEEEGGTSGGSPLVVRIS